MCEKKETGTLKRIYEFRVCQSEQFLKGNVRENRTICSLWRTLVRIKRKGLYSKNWI
jgi:hypothetical protein